MSKVSKLEIYTMEIKRELAVDSNFVCADVKDVKILLGYFFKLVLHKFRHAKHIFPLMKAGLKEFILSRRARFNSSVIFHTSIWQSNQQLDNPTRQELFPCVVQRR